MGTDGFPVMHSLIVLRGSLDCLVVQTPVLAGETVQLLCVLQTLARIPRVHVAKHQGYCSQCRSGLACKIRTCNTKTT